MAGKYIDYIVVRVDGRARQAICVDNKASWYGTPKKFYSREDAEKWIETHKPYKGASFYYEIEEAST